MCISASARLFPAMLLLLVLALACIPFSASETLASDKAALLAFKDAVEDNGFVLAGWDNYTDPCIDKWTGVSCTCYPFFEEYGAPERVNSCLPLDWGYDPNTSRVLQLNLGDVRITDWNVLGGQLPASLGDLTALRVLNLKKNNFTGPIPDSWSQLTNLEQLVLSENRITGLLPEYFQNFDRLKYIYLSNNNMTGALPIQWCFGSWWMFDVRNNPGICDEVPSCLFERLVTFEGTSLIDPVSDEDGGGGGYCGVAPPTCRREEDACWVLTPDPPWWTNPDRAVFSFPAFPSREGGVAPSYQWRIGTEPGSGDVADWAPFTGKNATQSAEVTEYGDTSEKLISQTVYVADGKLPTGVSLRQGSTYYVSVRGANAGGPLQGQVVTSGPVTVDSTPPKLPDGSGVYSGQYFANVPAQTNTNGLGVSWDPFLDPESGIKQYAYQVFEYVRDEDRANGESSYVGPSQTNKVKLKDPSTRDLYITKLSMEAKKSYFVRVFATNGAGIETHADAPPVSIVNPGEGIVVTNNTNGLAVSKVVILVAALVGATCAAVAVISFYLARERYRRRQQATRKYRGQLRNLRHLLNSLTEKVGDPEKDQIDELRQLKNMAFVITDLENSTGIASSAPRAFEWVQEAHDTLMRDLIAAYGGYEINTEGDAFHVAFKDVARAVHFCMEVQYQMMELEWPREVLRLPDCKEVRSPDGGWAFRGPRVRMGVHWAEDGSVMQHIHALTKHRVFTGPAFHVTRDLCESAVGGQVLLTHAVWERLRVDMSAAAFPVVEQLGFYKFAAWTEGVWVYQVTRLLGRPLHRPPGTAHALAGAERIVSGAGLSTTPVPTPRTARGDLAFVSCRLAAECCPAGATEAPLPEAVHSRLFEVLSSAAMQYEGHVFRMSESQGCYLLAFASAVDSVRFCHTAQVLLMYTSWPAEAADWCGAEDEGPDGKAVFKGPRVAMAIHASNDYSTRPVPMAAATADGAATLTDYLGPAEEVVRALGEVAHGGQVVLSEPAWAAVQDQLPGGPQVISLGSHVLEEPCFAAPAMLMEVMPQPLSKRSFPAPQRARMVDPGYRDAPSARGDVAIAHVRVVKPAVVSAAESAAADLSDDAIIRVVTAYNVALARAVRCARELLRIHGGYECKEPEPGKLTVAFRSLDSSLRWSAALQRGLLDVHWPREVLTWEECREIREGEELFGEEEDNEAAAAAAVAAGLPVQTMAPISSSGVLDGVGGDLASVAASGDASIVWRGLRVRIGIAVGVPTSKAPLNTGRADYFGTIPNLAARMVSVAQPGQVLFDAAKLNTLRTLQWRDDTGIIPGTEAFTEGVEITPLGQFAVKGLDDLRTVFQALPVGLQARVFEECAAAVRPVGASISRRIASLRKGSEQNVTGADGTGPTASPGQRKPNIFSSISRTNSASASAAVGGGVLRRGGTGTFGSSGGGGVWPISRTASRLSDSSDGTGALKAPAMVRASAFSASEASSGGSWLARGIAAAGLRVGPRTGSGGGGGPMSPGTGAGATDASACSTPKSLSAFPSPGPGYIPIPGAMQRQKTGGSDRGPMGSSNPAAADGFIIANDGTGPSTAASQQNPNAFTTLNDISDWSYPGSRTCTPSAVQKVFDHWDVGLAMEAALKSDGLDLSGHGQGSRSHSRSNPRGMPVLMLSDTEAPSPAGSLTLEAAEAGRDSSWQPNGGVGGGDPVEWRQVSTPRLGLTVQTTSQQMSKGGSGENGGEGGAGAHGGAGLQYARQIAQLFVDKRRKTLERSAARDRGGSSPPKTSWLTGKLRGGSKEVTPAGSPVKAKPTRGSGAWTTPSSSSKV